MQYLYSLMLGLRPVGRFLPFVSRAQFLSDVACQATGAWSRTYAAKRKGDPGQ